MAWSFGATEHACRGCVTGRGSARPPAANARSAKHRAGDVEWSDRFTRTLRKGPLDRGAEPMPSEPAVSVLMPVYNAERYVVEAVESILAQTFRDFEFLIIDDGSTDDSGAILSRYAARDDRIRLICRPNVGIVGTLNEMVEGARGEFLARMDA